MPKKPEQPKLSIYTCVSKKHVLIDHRWKTRGLLFGSIQQVAKQYGVSMEDCGRYLKFTAPQLRLQMFVEKLHFSGVQYTDQEPPENKSCKK
jgi:hypothetical protein